MKLELDAKIQINNNEYEVADLVDHFINLSAMEISDFFTYIKFFIPKKLKIDVLKDVLLEPVLELRRQKLTVADEKKYRLSWFQSYSEYQLEYLLYTLRDQALNEKFLRKLWLNVINYMVNVKVRDEDFERLISIAYNTVQQQPDNILKYNLELNRVFVDAKGELDGLKPEMFRPVLYKSATILEIRELAKKYDITVPQRLKKDQFLELIFDTLRKKGKYNNKVQLALENLTMTELQKYCLQYKLKLSADLNKEYIIEYILENSTQTNSNYAKPLTENAYNYEPNEDLVGGTKAQTLDDLVPSSGAPTVNQQVGSEAQPVPQEEKVVVEKIIIPKKNVPVENFEIKQDTLQVKMPSQSESEVNNTNNLNASDNFTFDEDIPEEEQDYGNEELNDVEESSEELDNFDVELNENEELSDDAFEEETETSFEEETETSFEEETETSFDEETSENSEEEFITEAPEEKQESFEEDTYTSKEDDNFSVEKEDNEFHEDQFIINNIEANKVFSTEPTREEIARQEHIKIMRSRCRERLEILNNNFQLIYAKYEKLNSKVQLLKQTKDCNLLAQNFTVLMNFINDFKASGETISTRIIEISVEFQEFFDNEIEFYKQRLINNINHLNNDLDNDVSILENLSIFCEEQAREDEVIKRLKEQEGAVFEKSVNAPDVDKLDNIKAQYTINNTEHPSFDFEIKDAKVEVTNFSRDQKEINRQKEKDFIEDLKPHQRKPVTFTPFNKQPEPEKTTEEIDNILRPVNSTKVDEKFDLEAIPKGELYTDETGKIHGEDEDEYLREFYAQTQKLTRKERKRIREAQKNGSPINVGPRAEIGTSMKLSKKPYGTGLSKPMKILIGIIVPLIVLFVLGVILLLIKK